PMLMAASAFTINPGASTNTAPIFVTQDGGATWSLRDTVPSEEQTGDISQAFSINGGDSLHVGILKKPGNLLLNELLTTDFQSNTLMSVQGSRSRVDQPFVQAITIGGSRRVYVGLNDLDAPGGRTAAVDVSVDGGQTFTPKRIESRNTFGQDGPSIQVAVA